MAGGHAPRHEVPAYRAGSRSFRRNPRFLYPQANIAKPASADYARRCKIVNVTSARPDDFTYPTEDIPTLILSGSLQILRLAPQFGEHVASNLETAYAYTLPDAAHAVVWTSPTTRPLSMAAPHSWLESTKAPDDMLR